MAAVAGLGNARDLIVDNVGGSDAQNDRGLVPVPASFGPYRTIARAMKAAAPGDRLVLRKTDQPYRESFSLNGPAASGTAHYPFVIIGNGATLDGSVLAEQPEWEPVGEGLFCYLPTPPGYGLLLLQDDRLRRVRFEGPARLNELQPMQWTRSVGRFYLRPEAGLMPSQYPIQVTGQTTGITLYDVQHVEIRDLTVRGFRLDGINAHDRATEVRLVNVQCEQNGRSGVSIGGASRVRIEASRFVGNGEAQIRTEGMSHATLEGVQVGSASAPMLIRNGGIVVGLPEPIEP